MVTVSAIFSVTGLGMLFGASALAYAMFATMDFSKIIITLALHDTFKHMSIRFKVISSVMVFFLTLVTTTGIYGGLTSRFEKVVTQLNTSDQRIELVNKRLDRLKSQDSTYQNLMTQLNNQISEYRTGLANPGKVRC